MTTALAKPHKFSGPFISTQRLCMMRRLLRLYRLLLAVKPQTANIVLRCIGFSPTWACDISGNRSYRAAVGLGDIYDAIPQGQNLLQGMGIVASAVSWTLAFL